jgi:hypothetical protein
MWRRSQSVLCYQHLCLNRYVIFWVFPCPSFCEICLPKANGAPQNQVKVNVLSWSEGVRIWDLLKGGMSGGGMGKKSSTYSMVPNCMHSWFSSMAASLESCTCGYQGSTENKSLMKSDTQNRRDGDKRACKGLLTSRGKVNAESYVGQEFQRCSRPASIRAQDVQPENSVASYL